LLRLSCSEISLEYGVQAPFGAFYRLLEMKEFSVDKELADRVGTAPLYKGWSQWKERTEKITRDAGNH
jgi:hypothetical protein